jgi:4-hydroxy-2-oxoheptanedioate aldolase
MKLPANTLKRALVAHEPQIGLWCTLASPTVAELLGGSGYDFLVLDCEHSPNDLTSILAQLQALAGTPTAAVVRPPVNDPVVFKRLLDIGARNLLVPMVQSADEARAAVAACRYPPKGIRGVAGSTRATRFGRISDYFARAADEQCLILQVETRQAVGQIEAIAAVDGVDGIFIGPSDLSADMGLLGQNAHPEVRAAVSDAIKRIRRAGRFAGVLTPVEDFARACLADGAAFVAVGNDLSLLARQSEALRARFGDTVPIR